MIKQIYRFLNPKFQNIFIDYPVNNIPRYNKGNPHHKLYDIINAKRDFYKNLLNEVLEFKDVFHGIEDSENEKNPTKPGWNNGFLPGLDMVAIYTMLAHFKPKKYLEVGSGNSTKMVHLAKTNLNLTTAIISIDPKPRAEIDDLADEVIREPFETIAPDMCRSLNEGDILFIDNSHRILPNSDSTAFYLDWLPELKKGVIVHVHDVYLPYDYPQDMCDRFYSEQYGLAINLLSNPNRYIPILPNFFISEDKELAGVIDEIWQEGNLKNVEKHGGSFWIRIGE